MAPDKGSLVRPLPVLRGAGRLLIALLLPSQILSGGCARDSAARHPVPSYELHSSAEHADFGVVYERSGDLDSAMRQYRWAVSKDPGNHVAWTNLGNVLAQRGQWDEAREAYEEALALSPGYGPAVNNLACTYLDQVPTDPARAMTILRAHGDLTAEAYRDVLDETMRRAQEMAAP